MDFFDMEQWVNKVLDIIAPVVPNQVVYLGHGVYELRWERDLTSVELDILRQNKIIEIRDEPYRLKEFSNWVALKCIWHRHSKNS